MVKVIPPVKEEIEGVKPHVAEKIYEMLKKGRRYFGSSGASLSHQAFNPEYKDKGIDETLAKVGLEGERDTTTFLKNWMKDKPNVVLIDSVHIRGEKEELDEETGLLDGADTDHVMVIGDEVIIIDTKRWRKKTNYQVGDNGEVLRANKPFPGGKVHMRQAIYKWLDYLHEDAKITGIVIINTEEITVYRTRNWYTQPYRLVELDRFQELLDQKWEDTDDEDKNKINSTLVSQIALSAVKPYDIYERVFHMESLRGFK